MIWPVTEQLQRSAMAKMWAIFPVAQDDPIHLRAIWGKGVPGKRPTRNITFTPAAYPNVAERQLAFTDKALGLNKQGYNIYICFNPISPGFQGDEHNGLSVKDTDIVRRRYLLIDFDRSQTSQPATDDEIDEILKVAHQLEKYAFYSKGHEPITVNSGNGVHVYLPIDLPNDDGSKLLCQNVLQALANKYDTATVKVDTGVFNASRITKVLGTIAYKGTEAPDDTGINERYYRMASAVE
ncbi:hypothetical protein [Sandarakinorhabdus oryzae]|uniref:hypothetical protein n=1 Tax=Sandarakinorhabdus oryzae TaxID=2675220 RepID=UPI0012E22794|nr:hypothetical protein [Sandarakinorhabdus oryzae]